MSKAGKTFDHAVLKNSLLELSTAIKNPERIEKPEPIQTKAET
jgi:hypothetical protein